MTPKHHHSKEKLLATTRLFRTMGTEAYIEIIHQKNETKRAEQSLEKAIECCFEKVRIFNRFDPESELSQFNRHIGNFRNASPDMLTLALHTLAFHKESDGLFDPRILSVLEQVGYEEDFSHMPPRPSIFGKLFSLRTTSLKHDLKVWGEMLRFETGMDFSGIAKGYILDRMADCLRNDRWRNFLVDSGGDMVLCGANREGAPWNINVENIPEASLMLAVTGKAIATSGITRKQWTSSQGNRYHHLINPRHPNIFSFDILSVTAISASAERADFLAKTLFLMGEKEGLSCATKHSIPAIFVTVNTKKPTKKTWHLTPSMKPYLIKQ